MTIFVIDKNNPVPPTTDWGHDAFWTDEPGDTVILKAGAEIKTSGGAAFGIFAYDESHIYIEGSVISEKSDGIYMGGEAIIATTGSIYGEIGVYFHGGDGYVNNAGQIVGESQGIDIKDVLHAEVVNSGIIASNSKSGNAIIAGLWSEEQTFRLDNSGTINGRVFAALLGTNHIVNKGTINGELWLSYGDDQYYGSDGVVTGMILLDSGDDLAIGGKHSEIFSVGVNDGDEYCGGSKFIDGGGGIDTIWLTASENSIDLRNTAKQRTGKDTWVEQRNIENVNGADGQDCFTGNKAANLLAGYGGADALIGMEGDDTLIGGAGDDNLNGGEGRDTAVFDGDMAQFIIMEYGDGIVSVQDRRADKEGLDYLSNIEVLKFGDGTFELGSHEATNDAPSSLELSSKLVERGATVGAVVGILTGVDPEGQKLSYALLDNAGGTFAIDGDRLILAKSVDGSSKSLSVTVRVTDSEGAHLSRSFTIGISDTDSRDGEVNTPRQVESVASVADDSTPSLRLNGGRKADKLTGGKGDDVLNGGLGRDTLKGNAGDDTFVFDTKLGAGNIDRIVDFVSGQDRIHLSKKVFKDLSAKGNLSSKEFHLGLKAKAKDDRIIYNKKSGALSYDADGAGTDHSAIKFAQIKQGSKLHMSDFFIV
ncbi:calcium-binding protein [Microvirga pudoricolor]|uniref:calcium-binding protein n=1 Tax=Microvirga pudoricolor TaxID=2778729 RepID=UPI00194E34A6|nr:hypothetical protein [Microvirga pudoricolor]MBM6596733.1 hypothetical protein [Microvirga pudoricolor]